MTRASVRMMSAMDKVIEAAERQREEARASWVEAVKLVLQAIDSEHAPIMLAHIDELRRVYIQAQSRLEGMALIWAAGREIYEVAIADEETSNPPTSIHKEETQ